MSGHNTAMASGRTGSPCAGNARKNNAYKAHFNPDWIKEWPALNAKSHKGDTYAFCRLCRCDFSISSGVSKTYSVTSLIVKICIEHRSDLAQDTVAALLYVKVKSPKMEYNRLHLYPA